MTQFNAKEHNCVGMEMDTERMDTKRAHGIAVAIQWPLTCRCTLHTCTPSTTNEQNLVSMDISELAENADVFHRRKTVGAKPFVVVHL